MARCIITGCDLVDTARDCWCHGDLWAEGGVWVFVGCSVNLRPAWQFTNFPDETAKVLALVKDHYSPFERCGVFVIAADAAVLNDTASDYVRAGLVSRL